MQEPPIAPCAVRGIALLGETIVLSRFIAPAGGGAPEEDLFAATLAKGGTLAGPYVHADVLGRAYGSRVPSREQPPAGAAPHPPAHALRLTPELWTKSLPHRTQILFAVDIAMVVARLALRPGSTVVESGTGSGSLTHALARAVAPGGAVHTFEFNAARAAQAREEVLAHGLGAVVRVAHRDAVAQGFLAAETAGARGSEAGVAPRGASAAFLDLPNPWEAVGHARACLAPGGILCSFSPCIEQVQRTCAAMAAAGFEDVRTFETLLRPWDFAPARDEAGGGGGAGAAGAGAGAAEAAAIPFVPTPKITACAVLQPNARARGHTGYLTFAHLYI